MGNSTNARAIAARILAKLLTNKGSLNSHLALQSDHKDAPLLQEICYGVCRYYFALKNSVDQHLEKPLRKKDQDIYCLLLVGAYQIYCMRVPDHASLNETVDASRALKKPWASGLINAVLRQLLERRSQWQTLLDSDQEEIRFLHPHWMIKTVQQDWPDHWQEILVANNQRAPMVLRTNKIKTTRDDYLVELEKAGIEARAGKLATTAIYLESACPVEQLPGFSQGLVSVQDEASQLVPALMDLAAGQKVLDACAAPGGKACHILETEPLLDELLAVDVDQSRLGAISENLTRLGLQAQVKAVDASLPDEWWDGTPFQRILLDAPCSATGVIRRHSDIKILRQQQEIESLAERQLTLLESLWPCLAPGGLLLYTTCSVFKAENDATIERFLAFCRDAKYQAIAADWGVECAFGRQLLPDTNGSDGFYYALLKKR